MTLTLWSLTLDFDCLFENFNLGHNFWLVGGRAFIFHMCIPSFDTMTLTHWHLTFFSKTSTLVINIFKKHSLNALLHWNFWWDKRNSANFETLGGVLSDLVSLLVNWIIKCIALFNIAWWGALMFYEHFFLMVFSQMKNDLDPPCTDRRASFVYWLYTEQ
jgi:hypothetical protein